MFLKRGRLFDSSFQGLFRLENLALGDCDFKNFKSESFRYVPNLERLEIIGSRNFYAINFNELSKLKSLYLRDTWDICESLKNDNLKTLTLEDNLNYFDGKCISGLSKLKSLSLTSISERRCKIKSISSNYDSLSCLESLDLENFHFSSFHFFTFYEFCNLKQLSFVDCSAERKINHVDLFKRLGQLQKLSIRKFSDFFNGISSNVFDDLENLTYLNISHNELTNINPLWFSHMQKLESLDLSRNKINRLTKEMFRHLTNLTTLCLNGNEFNQLDDGAFSYLKNLKNLEISFNETILEFKSQLFDGLDKLRNLLIRNMNDNFQLDVDLFHALPSLKHVYVDKRFESMQSQLSQKYGSQITFYFLN